MSGHSKWSETRNARLRTAEDHERYAKAKEILEQELATHARTLGQVRRARRLTQQQLSRTMRVSQAQVSRIENQADLYLSTLRSYIEAMGGELQLRVTFPGGEWSEITIDEATELSGAEIAEAPIVNDSLSDPLAVLAESVSGIPEADAAAWQAKSAVVLSWLLAPGSTTPSIFVADSGIALGILASGAAQVLSPEVLLKESLLGTSSGGQEDFTVVDRKPSSWIAANGDVVIPADPQQFIDSAHYRESDHLGNPS